ncbi:hypothetical protein CapIbe_012447 [Capra ibex]
MLLLPVDTGSGRETPEPGCGPWQVDRLCSGWGPQQNSTDPLFRIAPHPAAGGSDLGPGVHDSGSSACSCLCPHCGLMRGCESAGWRLGSCWRGRPSLAPRMHPRPQKRGKEGGSGPTA